MAQNQPTSTADQELSLDGLALIEGYLTPYLEGSSERVRFQTPGKDDDPGVRDLRWIEQAGAWALCDLMRQSTHGLRVYSERALPPEPKEPQEFGNDHYGVRVLRSFLFEAYDQTICAVRDAPFSQPLKLHEAEGLTDPLGLIEKDADGLGKDLTTYFAQRFEMGVHQGFSATIVDAPGAGMARLPGGGAAPRTRAQQERLGLHPFFVPVNATNIIGVDLDPDVFGPRGLAAIRILDTRTKKRGKYGQEKVSIVREWTRDEWAVYESESIHSGDFRLARDESGKALRGTHGLGEVPIRVWYSDFRGPFRTRPPFLKLAWMNLAHAQSHSDLRNLIRKASLTLIGAYGYDKNEIPENIALGMLKIIRSEKGPGDAKLEMLESSGAPITVAAAEVERLEARMHAIGAEPFLQQMSGVLATMRVASESKKQTQVQAWSRTMERHIRDCYELAARWVTNASIPDDFRAELHDRDTLPTSQNSAGTVIAMRKEKIIDLETAILEMQRRNEIDRNTDPREIARKLELEQTRAMELFGQALGEDDEDEDEDEDEGTGDADENGDLEDEDSDGSQETENAGQVGG